MPGLATEHTPRATVNRAPNLADHKDRDVTGESATHVDHRAPNQRDLGMLGSIFSDTLAHVKSQVWI